MITNLKNLLKFLLIIPGLAFSQQQINDEGLKELISKNPNLLNELEINQGNIDQSIKGEDTSLDSEDYQGTVEGGEANTENENMIFGSDFIKSIPRSISATADLPVPNDYIISLGDKLKIILTGGKQDIYVLEVGMDGSIFFPELGKVNIFGESITSAKEIIEQLVKLSYVGTDVSVSLDSLSAKKISIIGAVKNPGTYIISPFSTISSALAYSGGLETYASLRNIAVIRKGKEISFDLYEFLIFGNRLGDINIQQGDTILVKPTNNQIKILGNVNRPMIYEYKVGDTYSDLINFALGVSRNGSIDGISVNIDKGGALSTFRKDIKEVIGNEKIESIFVGSKVSAKNLDVFVTGDSVTSGYYPANNTQLSEFMKSLKFSGDIYPFYAIYEKNEDGGLSKSFKTFSLADPESYADINITKNSKLHFFSRDDISNFNSDESTVTKFFEPDIKTINFPTQSLKIPISGRISPIQLYNFFGIKIEVDFKKISAVTTDNTLTNASESILDSKSIVAISFPSLDNPQLISVEILGEVMNPGTYTISSSSSLDDLYLLAGGFREGAFASGIVLLREEVRLKQIEAMKEAKSILTDSIIQKSSNLSDRGEVDIESIIKLADLYEPKGRIAGNFSPNTGFSKEFLLKDGDKINVPSTPSSITIQGEVLNSTSIIYDTNYSYSDYIKAAGGYTHYADEREVFIIRAGGDSVPVGNMFTGRPEILPGDTIVVPRDLNQLETLPLISIATKILADIAFSAASINAIQN